MTFCVFCQYKILKKIAYDYQVVQGIFLLAYQLKSIAFEMINPAATNSKEYMQTYPAVKSPAAKAIFARLFLYSRRFNIIPATAITANTTTILTLIKTFTIIIIILLN